jgi:hypothetical protein
MKNKNNNLIYLSLLLLISIGANNTLAQTTSQMGSITHALEQKGISRVADILFDSPTKLVLRGAMGQESNLKLAINTAKENGYAIDSVTVLAPKAEVSLGGIYTVFMSK